MRLIFTKYNSPSGYYFGEDNEFLDRIEILELPPDGFPVHNEELLKENNSRVLKFGDKDIKLSYLQGELSTLGKTVEQFFSKEEINIDTYILAMQNVGDSVYLPYNVDIPRLLRDLTYNKNRYHVNLTLFGLLKDYEQYLAAQVYSVEVNGNISFNSYMELQFEKKTIIPNTTPPDLYIDNRLNVATVVGFMPIVHGEFHDEGIIDENEDTLGGAVTKLNIFSDLQREWGFMPKLIIENPFTALPTVKMLLYFRGDGYAEDTLEVEEHLEGYSKEGVNTQYIFIRNGRYNVSGNEEETAGILVKKDGSFWALDIARINVVGGAPYFEIDNYNKVVRIVSLLGTEQETPFDEITFIDYTQYVNTNYNYNNGFPAEYLISHIFCREVNGIYGTDYNTIFQKIHLPEVLRMFTALKTVKFFKVKMRQDSTLTVGKYYPIDGIKYIIERIRNRDLQTETADIELMQA